MASLEVDFNPGFSTSNLMALVPGIVQDASTFCRILREHASKGKVFQLQEPATKVTLDIIGRVTL